jgi:predicted dinucleotide-binding enzyme
MVGHSIAGKLVELGHEVVMGARQKSNEKAVAWAAAAGENAGEGDFSDAGAFGEVVFNCTAGSASLEALSAARRANLEGKLLIDVSMPLDFSQGTSPSLFVSNTDSLGERIQRAHPEARVVKSLNTVNHEVMVNPGLVPGDHVNFVCGDDEGAKREAAELLGEFGWPADRIVDLGGISAARGTEMYLAMWLRIWEALGTTRFNITLRHHG